LLRDNPERYADEIAVHGAALKRRKFGIFNTRRARRRAFLPIPSVFNCSRKASDKRLRPRRIAAIVRPESLLHEKAIPVFTGYPFGRLTASAPGIP
jgi:hypothetical protein